MHEAEWLWNMLASFGFGGLVAGAVVYLICTRWLSSYLSKKGENLATKEDIAAVTKLVKSVEHQYNVLIHEMNAKQQLRMAAVDKRLQAHQEAFTLWRKLIVAIDDETHPIIQCQEWWNSNCLYLEPDVRQAFVSAYSNAHLQEALVRGRASSKEILEASRKVMEFPDVLFKAVQLPGLTDVESKEVAKPIESPRGSI